MKIAKFILPSIYTNKHPEDFFIYFHYKSMVDNDMPGGGLYGPQGHRWQHL